jgi:hypothetical protein
MDAQPNFLRAGETGKGAQPGRIVALSYYEPFFVPIVRGICERTGWTVSDWIGARDASADPAAAFPGAVVQRPEHAARGLLPEGIEPQDLVELDEAILARMAPYESMFMRMLEFYDPDGHSFSERERRFAYFAVLRSALSIVRKHRPTVCFAGTTPHALYDYMMYAVCRAHDIPTFVYIPFAVPGYQLLYTSVEHAHARLAAVYREKLARFSGGEVSLPPDLDKYLASVRRDYSAGEPWYTRLRDHTMLADQPWLSKARSRYRHLRHQLRFALDFLKAPWGRYEAHFVRPLADFFKRRGVRLRDSTTSQHQANRVYTAGVGVKKKMLKRYRELQRAPDLSANFIFVPLHYQPEATTTPLGGNFSDQLLMIRLLAAHLPKGWKMYVKEHRTIFDPVLRGSFSRDLDYYREIVEIPGAQIVPMELSSFDLIDRTRAVATVTGTAGWEAVVRGVPALVFGNAWYANCEGTFDASTHEGCARAMAAIVRGYRPDYTRVRLFLQALAEVGLRADRDIFEVLTELTPEQSQRATVEHFLREYALRGTS